MRISRSYWNYFTVFLGILASFVTLLVFSRDFFPELSSDGKIAAIFLGFFGLYFFIHTLVLQISQNRSEKYMRAVNLIFNGLSEIYTLNPKKQDAYQIITHFRSLCTQLAHAYTLITGTKCAVSIKILTIDEHKEELKAVTFCRDNLHKKIRDIHEAEHWIDANTDFRKIFENIETPNKWYFFSNNLPALYGYQNTSFKIHGEPGETVNIPLLKDLIRNWQWKLPYRSTIVVPICGMTEQNRSTSLTLVGYLCIDSPKLFVFKKMDDVNLLRGVAEAIYNPINEISLLEEKFLNN